MTSHDRKADPAQRDKARQKIKEENYNKLILQTKKMSQITSGLGFSLVPGYCL